PLFPYTTLFRSKVRARVATRRGDSGSGPAPRRPTHSSVRPGSRVSAGRSGRVRARGVADRLPRIRADIGPRTPRGARPWARARPRGPAPRDGRGVPVPEAALRRSATRADAGRGNQPGLGRRSGPVAGSLGVQSLRGG